MPYSRSPHEASKPPLEKIKSVTEQQRRHMDAVWQGRAARLFCLLATTLAALLLLRYALPCLTPFLLAWLLSFPIRKGARLLQQKCRIPRRLSAFLLLLAVVLPLGALLVYAGERLLAEIQQLLTSLGTGEQIVAAIAQLTDFFTRITAHIPPLRGMVEDGSMNELWAQIDAHVATVVNETLGRWSARIPEVLTSLVRSFPSLLFFLFTFLITLVYCCADDGAIAQFLSDLIPTLWRPHWQRLRAGLSEVGGKYLRAYSLLFLLTFAQLFFGLTVLRVPYRFLPALLIALLDILPLFGAGMVLLPWGLIAWLRGDVRLAVGLLILFGVMLLLRQLLEPRILGSTLGLHPLASLLAVYAGWQLGGVWGMIVAPGVAVVIKSIWKKEPSA